MFKALTIGFLIAFSLFTASASNVILIDDECITLRDIFPAVALDENVYCGLDYGEEKTINSQMSLYIINKYNIAGAAPGVVTFRRNGTLLGEDRLKKDIADLLSVMYSDVDVEIEGVRMNRDFYFSESKGYNIDIPKGRFGNVSISVDNGKKRLGFTATLTAYGNVYIAKSSIKKGQDITGLVEIERMDLSKVRGESISRAEGYIAVRNLSAGRPVTTGDVILKPDALKGTTVQLLYKSGALNVTTAGELEEDAYIGKNVRVKNTASGKFVRGVYTAGRKVLVNDK